MPGTYVCKPCRECGGPKARDKHGRMRGWYCASCSEKSWVQYDHQNRYCASTTDDHQRWNCLDCQRVKTERQREAAARGAATRAKNNPRWRKPIDAQKYWQGRAHGAVQAAIKRGLLPSLKSGDYACTDCGGIALEYDHRDYGRPLDVDPVCRSCNKQRGTAIWPSPERYAFKRIEPEAKPSKKAA